jgi:hypothetical protein
VTICRAAWCRSEASADAAVELNQGNPAWFDRRIASADFWRQELFLIQAPAC